MDTQVNYVGITRRVAAGVVDRVIAFVIFKILCLQIIYTYILGKNAEIIYFSSDPSYSFARAFIEFFIFTLKVLLITRFSGTPGQLLCGIHIKDANTIKNVTITQAAIRCVFREVVINIIGLSTRYISIWFEPLSILILIVIILIFMSAIFDRRRQFFHDKIARTVAINSKSSS